jgi:hypothetical protein
LDGQVGEGIETNHEKAQTERNGIMIL